MYVSCYKKANLKQKLNKNCVCKQEVQMQQKIC